MILAAQVVAVDKKHVVIICPICGRFHQHGSNGSISETNYGTRVPHCVDDFALRFDGQYELITSGSTVRKMKLSDQDIAIWRYEQERKRAMILGEWHELEVAEANCRILEAIREAHVRGQQLTRWGIAQQANVPPHTVTQWMHQHGIYYGGGRYRVISRSQAGPELCKIFGAPA